jgi:hypothetical protein
MAIIYSNNFDDARCGLLVAPEKWFHIDGGKAVRRYRAFKSHYSIILPTHGA